ncbi:hypothetical protein R84981_002090 [Carnimonas sp. R-84981]|uniref:hypothetical protein n=1 Tax=Carnimonas bestiolae TaxID=3402172 RepID=UPI003EDC98E9
MLFYKQISRMEGSRFRTMENGDVVFCAHFYRGTEYLVTPEQVSYFTTLKMTCWCLMIPGFVLGGIAGRNYATYPWMLILFGIALVIGMMWYAKRYNAMVKTLTPSPYPELTLSQRITRRIDHISGSLLAICAVGSLLASALFFFIINHRASSQTASTAGVWVLFLCCVLVTIFDFSLLAYKSRIWWRKRRKIS